MECRGPCQRTHLYPTNWSAVATERWLKTRYCPLCADTKYIRGRPLDLLAAASVADAAELKPKKTPKHAINSTILRLHRRSRAHAAPRKTRNIDRDQEESGGSDVSAADDDDAAAAEPAPVEPMVFQMDDAEDPPEPEPETEPEPEMSLSGTESDDGGECDGDEPLDGAIVCFLCASSVPKSVRGACTGCVDRLRRIASSYQV